MSIALAVLALAPVFGLLACVALHIILSRTVAQLPRLHGIGLSALGGLGVVVGMLLQGGSGAMPLFPNVWELTGVWLLTYLFLTYCYVIGFFNLGESARRIRLLIELYGAGDRGMTLHDILTEYNSRMIVEIRSLRLVTGGQIVERGDRYFIERRFMLYAAKAFVLLKLVFLGGKSGRRSNA